MDYLGTWSPRQWARAALVVTVAAGVLYVVIAAWSVLVPFVLGAIIGWIILPIVNWLESHLPRSWHRHGIARLIAIVAVYAVALALIATFFVFFVPALVRQAQQLVARQEEISIAVRGALENVRQFIQANLPQAVQQFIFERIPETPAEVLSLAGGAVLSTLTAVLRGTLPVLFGYLIVPFWLAYLLYEAERFGRAGISLFPETSYPDVRNISRILNDVAGAYLRGQVLVAIIVGTLSGLAYSLLGIDFPVLLGVVAAVGDLIPTFGPIIAGATAVVIAFIERPILAVWAIVATFAVQQFESIFVGPRVVGASVRLSPAVIIVLLFIAGSLWGFIGLLFVVPITAVLRDIVKYLYLRTSPRGISPDQAMRDVRKARR